MLQSGYAADFILGLTVESLNGVRNRSAAGGIVREADPDFIAGADVAARRAGRRRLRYARGGRQVQRRDRRGVLPARDVSPEISAKSAEIRRLLKMPPDQQKFTLIYSPGRGAENELAVNSRSMMQIMSAFASYIDVPEAHIRTTARGLPLKAALTRAVRNRCGSTVARKAGVRLYSRVLPRLLVLGRQRRLAVQARHDGNHVLLHAGGYGRKRKLPLITIPAQ